ncbi:unnamed protein product [Alopecurus aequalis]
MAGIGEDEEAPHPPPPSPPLDRQPMGEAAAAGELSRVEQHHGAGDAPDSPTSFRMEDLPAEIQTAVMSLLPLKEAVRASVVSTSWSMLWTFHSNLCFYGGPFDLHLERDLQDTTKDHNIVELIKFKRAKFIDDVNGIIQRHSGIGVNKFSIRCGLHKEDLDHLHRWIRFAATSKANIIGFNLEKSFWESKELKEVHHFPLEALDVQGNSCVQSFFLAHVSIKLHSGICGFNILRRLVLKCVQIFGDFPGLLVNCSALEDLEIINCFGVTNLSIPHQLDKLHHLLIVRMDVEMIEVHAANLAHFEYEGEFIPIVLHGCSKLEKATMMIDGRKGLGRVFTLVPSILPVKILNVKAWIVRYKQLQKVTPRSHRIFTHLRHMTCELMVCSEEPNAGNGVLQLAYCLNVAPQLETLRLDMIYSGGTAWSDEVVVEEEGSPMCRHDHLRTVYIGGFRLYTAQTKLACCILENAHVLEHMQLEPRCGDWINDIAFAVLNKDDDVEKNFLAQVCEWARLASLRFGKVVTGPSEGVSL